MLMNPKMSRSQFYRLVETTLNVYAFEECIEDENNDFSKSWHVIASDMTWKQAINEWNAQYRAK